MTIFATEVEEPGARFENLVAVHLKKACEYWTDSGLGDWDLRYLRNKEKKEVDFLITKKSLPIASFECRTTDTTLDRSFLAFAKQIKLKHHIQIVARPDVWQRHEVEGVSVLVASAEIVLGHFV